MDTFSNLIGGEWTEGANVTENINPSNTDDVIGRYASGDAAQANAAIAAAKAAAPAWARTNVMVRHNILKAAAAEIFARSKELGDLLAREEGKTLAEGIGEAGRAGQIFDFFAGECLRLAGDKVPSIRPNVEIEITRAEAW